MSQTTFRTEWDKAVGSPGLRFWTGWLPSCDAASALEAVSGVEGDFPWNLKPRLFGQSLPQHAYHYKRHSKGKVAELVKKHRGLQVLEQITQRLESSFQTICSDVYCNRLADPEHHLDWHQDQYGSHIFVLTLGSPRVLEYRHNKSGEVTGHTPQTGDLYFMSLQHNKEYHHRVLAGGQGVDTRVSFVFFATPPGNLPEYKLSMGDRARGVLNGMFA